MSFRRLLLAALMAGPLAAGGLATASPAWATDGDTTRGCHLTAEPPKAPRSTLSGTGSRRGCADTVNYFWVRVYEVVPMWPDAERAVRGSTYVQNDKFSATGPCDGNGHYYTHTSTATGLTGDNIESDRALLC